MVLVSLFNILGGDGVSFILVPVVPFVTAASVLVAPLLNTVVPLGNSHHLVEGVDVYVHPVTSGNVDKLFSSPISLVDHVLFGPVDRVLPVTDHLPSLILDIIRILARFDIDSLFLVSSVSGESSPVLDVLWVYEVLAPSHRVVSSPGLTRLVNGDCTLVQLVSQHANFLSQHANLFPGSEGGDPMGNWNLNSLPNDLLNGLIRHIEGISRANDIKGIVHVV